MAFFFNMYFSKKFTFSSLYALHFAAFKEVKSAQPFYLKRAKKLTAAHPLFTGLKNTSNNFTIAQLYLNPIKKLTTAQPFYINPVKKLTTAQPFYIKPAKRLGSQLLAINNFLQNPILDINPDDNILADLTQKNAVMLENNGILEVKNKAVVIPKNKADKKRSQTLQYRVKAESLRAFLSRISIKTALAFGGVPTQAGEICLASSITTISGAFRNKPIEIGLRNIPAYDNASETVIALFYTLLPQIATLSAQPNSTLLPVVNLPTTFNFNRQTPNTSQGMAIILDVNQLVSKNYNPQTVATTQPTRGPRGTTKKKAGAATEQSAAAATVAAPIASLLFQRLPITVTVFLGGNISGTLIYATEQDFQQSQTVTDGATFTKYDITIEAVDTVFDVAVAEENVNNVPRLVWQKYKYMSFQIYNDNTNFERIYVDQKYLGVMFHKNVLLYIEKLQSTSVLYTDIIFSTSQAKEWDSEGNALYAPHTLFLDGDSKCLYNAYHTGINPSPQVNKQNQLMFSAVFPNDPADSATNRFVPLTVCESLNDLSDNKELILDLQEILSKTIILSQQPEIKLIPVFKRGRFFKTPTNIVFRGLVPNSSKKVSP